MKKKSSSSSNHSHIMLRYGLISVLILFFAGCITFKLFGTTVINADKWNAKANKELSKTDTIMPLRGDILACDGTVLVTNLCYYDVRIDFRSGAFKEKEFRAALPALSDSLAKYFPHKSAKEWEDGLKAQIDKDKDKRSRSYRLLKQISFEEYQRLLTFPFFEIPNRNKTGLIAEPIMKRDRPYGSMARRSIGGVGQTKECKEVHGISGIERSIDSLLFGTPGVYKRVPLTRHIGNWTDIPAINGYNVTTTIDITMQELVEQELQNMLDSCGADWGTAVLMEVATGDIKAISNLEYKDGRYIEAFNRACVGYEPGSVVKTISMMFALEDGLVNDIDSVIQIGNSYAYGGGRPISDSHYIGQTTVAGVIEQSSNIGMARIITNPRGRYNSDPEAFSRRFEEIGFYEKMYSGIAEEERPRIPRHPSRLDMSRMCFGYATAIPPLYTLSVYNAIANNGVYVRPRLVKGLSRNGVDSVIPVSYIRPRICSEKNAAKLRTMLRRVVDGEHGTARRHKNCIVPLAGKTGTCYHLDTVTKSYDTSKKRLAFCGFFPADAPKYSMFVLTFHPRRNLLGAAACSGLVLRNVAEKLYSRGLLDNYSDYRENRPDKTRQAVINASEGNADSSLRAALGADNTVKRRPAKAAEADTGDLPRVIDMNLRQAINAIERTGREVKFTGEGRVIAQKLSDDGRTVTLTLSNK